MKSSRHKQPWILKHYSLTPAFRVWQYQIQFPEPIINNLPPIKQSPKAKKKHIHNLLKKMPLLKPPPSTYFSYHIARGEQGVLTFELYKSYLLPLWRFRTVPISKSSSEALWEKFLEFYDVRDFVGMVSLSPFPLTRFWMYLYEKFVNCRGNEGDKGEKKRRLTWEKYRIWAWPAQNATLTTPVNVNTRKPPARNFQRAQESRRKWRRVWYLSGFGRVVGSMKDPGNWRLCSWRSKRLGWMRMGRWR